MACGKCCEKHWLVHLSGNKELKMFKEQLVFIDYMWTDLCPYLKDGKCAIQDNKPQRCKDFFCEGREVV